MKQAVLKVCFMWELKDVYSSNILHGGAGGHQEYLFRKRVSRCLSLITRTLVLSEINIRKLDAVQFFMSLKACLKFS